MLALPDTYTDPKKYTQDLCDFIATPLVQQLTGGIHVNDALIYGAWESLPQDWTSWWATVSDHRVVQRDLIGAIENSGAPATESHDGHSRLDGKRPESLRKWLHTLNALALPRHERQGPIIQLPEILTSRMKTKKIAEISKAVAYVKDVCQRKGITRVIDMGSGQGYLSVSLAYLFPDTQVLAIDGSEAQIAGSQAFAKSLGIPDSRLKHVLQWIDGSAHLAKLVADWAGGQKCMLVGLHACGDLSDHMLRNFASLSCVEELGAIGCCYNHITLRSTSCPDGFPRSSALRNENFVLSPTALMTACQAPNNWVTPDSKETDTRGDSVFSRRRLYRAILEKVFFDKGLTAHANDRPAWGIRKGDMTDFTKYAHRAMDCLDIGRDEISLEELRAYEERYRDDEGRIAILWTLGVLCCKVVESSIMMDRYWWLVEQQVKNVNISPIFNTRVSPRNLIITAEKNKI